MKVLKTDRKLQEGIMVEDMKQGKDNVIIREGKKYTLNKTKKKELNLIVDEVETYFTTFAKLKKKNKKKKSTHPKHAKSSLYSK